jgi:predicted chitinase
VITIEQLQACTGASRENAEKYLDALNAAMEWAEINTPQRQAAFLATTANPAALSQKLYGGFHGRGLIQLTWERNYKACGDALGIDFVSNPASLLEPSNAAMSAAWFWKENKCNLPADAGDMDRVTRIVNGPAKLHLKERIEWYQKGLAALTL